MDTQRFDIWLHAFASNSDEPAAHALARIFGISLEMAERLLVSLPRVVRKDAPVLQAQRIASALESIGGRAEMVVSPLRPAPVVKVGEEAQDSLPNPPSIHPPSIRPPSFRPAAQISTGQTLVMPMQTDNSFVIERTSPSEVHPQSPLDLMVVLDPSRTLDRNLVVDPQHALDLTAVGESPRIFDLGMGSAGSLDIANERPQVHIKLALPALDALAPAADALRRPSSRTRDPSVRTPSSRPPGPLSSPPPASVAPSRHAERLLAPLTLSLRIAAHAERSSWQDALRSHPAAGFLLVLLGTTFVFCLLYLVAS